MKKTNGELKIEKGVPLPQARSRGLSKALRGMKIGDSLLTFSGADSARNVAAQVLGAGKYATRQDKGGIRIWRTK
jgi:hypothetical protein